MAEAVPETFLLLIQDLACELGGRQVLRGVSLALRPRQVAAIVGPNGAGKTTVLKAIGGLIRPVTGRIIFAGEDLAPLPVWDIVSRGVVYVPEGTEVFPEMTVLENLEVGGYLNRIRIPERLALVYDIFPELQQRRRQLAGRLSGGQQRLVVLGRALMAEVKLLLLDDPFLGLSPKYVKIFCDAFRILRRQGVTLLISGQHVRRILNVADLAFLIEEGRITLAGTGAELLADQHLRRTLFSLEGICQVPVSRLEEG